MTERQRKFVDEYILCTNATQAARRAGYSEQYANRQGHKLLSNPFIRAEIDSRLDDARNEKTLEQSDLLEFLSSVVLGEVGDEQLMTRLTGKGTSQIERHELRASVKDRLRAAELLLKVQGAFRDRVDVKVDSSELFVRTLENIWHDEAADQS